MSNELLFEIGTEEIPAAFLSKAVGDMEEIIGKSLTEKRIAFTGIKCLATPRRLVLYICGCCAKTGRPDSSKSWGPPKRPLLMKTANRRKPRWDLPEDREWKSPNWKPSSLKKVNIWARAKPLPDSQRQTLLPEILDQFPSGDTLSKIHALGKL